MRKDREDMLIKIGAKKPLIEELRKADRKYKIEKMKRLKRIIMLVALAAFVIIIIIGMAIKTSSSGDFSSDYEAGSQQGEEGGGFDILVPFIIASIFMFFILFKMITPFRRVNNLFY